jgi:hypothetical protein
VRNDYLRRRRGARPQRGSLNPTALHCCLTVLLVAVAALSACRPDPTANTSTAQALIELGDELNGVRNDNAVLQEQIDSLKQVVARQDTLIQRLAAAQGVQLPK